MITVGAFEAKTNLSSLLDRVAAGEEVLITKHGRPVARLTRAEVAEKSAVDEAIAELLALRRGAVLEVGWRAARDAGRR